jgi:hypothetical protein
LRRSFLTHRRIAGRSPLRITDRNGADHLSGGVFSHAAYGSRINLLAFIGSPAFYREIYRVLREYCGNPIHEIADIDICYAPKPAEDDR